MFLKEISIPTDMCTPSDWCAWMEHNTVCSTENMQNSRAANTFHEVYQHLK